MLNVLIFLCLTFYYTLYKLDVCWNSVLVSRNYLTLATSVSIPVARKSDVNAKT